MASEEEVDEFINSQKSIQFYKKFQKALKKVLMSLPDKDYEKITKNIIIMALHEGALAQVMHFKKKGMFQIAQFTIPKNISIKVLSFVIAHEFGHVLQGRNWKPSDGGRLEEDADKQAEEWGFPKTKEISKWMEKHQNSLT